MFRSEEFAAADAVPYPNPGEPVPDALREAYRALSEALAGLELHGAEVEAAVSAYETSVNDFVAAAVMTDDILLRLFDSYVGLSSRCPDPVWDE